MEIDNNHEAVVEENKENIENTEKYTKDQINWAKDLRLQFSNPEMIDEEGNINTEYFKPTKIKIKPDWDDTRNTGFLTGIEKYGIGKWKEMKNDPALKNLLGPWNEGDLRVRAMKIMGRQSLKHYTGWKGNPEQIKREFERNKQLGLKYGTWRANCLVNDDGGLVEGEIIKQMEKEQRDLMK